MGVDAEPDLGALYFCDHDLDGPVPEQLADGGGGVDRFERGDFQHLAGFAGENQHECTVLFGMGCRVRFAAAGSVTPPQRAHYIPFIYTIFDAYAS